MISSSIAGGGPDAFGARASRHLSFQSRSSLRAAPRQGSDGALSLAALAAGTALVAAGAALEAGAPSGGFAAAVPADATVREGSADAAGEGSAAGLLRAGTLFAGPPPPQDTAQRKSENLTKIFCTRAIVALPRSFCYTSALVFRRRLKAGQGTLNP